MLEAETPSLSLVWRLANHWTSKYWSLLRKGKSHPSTCGRDKSSSGPVSPLKRQRNSSIDFVTGCPTLRRPSQSRQHSSPNAYSANVSIVRRSYQPSHFL